MSGIAVGGAVLSFGQAQIGLPIIGGSGTASFILSGTSTSLRLIDYSINGGQDRFNSATESFGKLVTGAVFGRARERAISTVRSFTIQKFPGVIF